MDRLNNTIQEYAWGSRTAIAELLGQPTPSPKPQAEIWMGAHPSAPSRLERDASRTLLEAVAADPVLTLGAQTAQAHGGRLPFLFKVLAAGQPLSLQAHPTLAQAEAGFDREEALGVPLSAPHRLYKDRNHKPEILCALGRFDALCGFRRASDTLRLLEALGVPALHALLAPLRASPDGAGLRALFESLMRLAKPAAAALLADALPACAARSSAGPDGAAYAWAVKLGAQYPGDIGALCSLMLNLLQLEAGHAVYLPAGNLHAYLSGLGVELMANSDNVLRGGLTPKHVDLDELLRVLEFTDGPVPALEARGQGGEQVYETPAREFRLSRWQVDGATERVERWGPEILLCTEGRVTIEAESGTLELARGGSAFVSAADGRYLLRGRGTAFRAAVNR